MVQSRTIPLGFGIDTEQYQEIIVEKQRALDQKYEINPERFVNGRPIAKAPPNIVEINPIPQELVDEDAQSIVNFPTLSSVKERMLE